MLNIIIGTCSDIFILRVELDRMNLNFRLPFCEEMSHIDVGVWYQLDSEYFYTYS